MTRHGPLSIASMFLGVIAILASRSAVEAKGPVERIVIRSPGEQPVQVAEGAALETFTPWSRAFIAWDRGIATAAPVGPPMQVAFYLDDSRPELLYEIDYVFDAKAGSGLAYIPGAGDPRTPLNSRTIMGASTSDGWDPRGKWQYTTAEWDAFIRDTLAARGIPPVPATEVRGPSSAAVADPVVLGAIVLAVVVIGVTTQRLVRDR